MRNLQGGPGLDRCQHNGGAKNSPAARVPLLGRPGAGVQPELVLLRGHPLAPRARQWVESGLGLEPAVLVGAELVARDLPSRVTAFKLITVVSAFSEREVQQLGGTEKCYAVARYAKKEKPDGDPRRYLASSMRIAGRTVAELSAREINQEVSSKKKLSPTASAAAKKASARLGRALTRAAVPHHMRVHPHKGACVSVHLGVDSAEMLVGLLGRLKKLEKASR